MKKKPLLFIILLLVFGSAFWYFKYVYGWLEFRKNTDTPTEFLSHVTAKREDYSRDSINVLQQFRYLLHTHKKSFYDKTYFDSTRLIIDTIIYGPTFNKLAVFVITKNPTYRQLMPDKQYDWYYDGYCYLGVKENDTVTLSWIGNMYINFYDKKELVSSLREFYFRMFAGIKDTSGVYRYKYNLNDTRFWNCPIWGEIEEQKQREKDFEELKKNHPEDVYEPKN